MTTFLNSLQRNLNTTHTENGDKAHKSSLDPVVDYFGLAGAMRDRPRAAADLFAKAYVSDRQTAVRTLFYLRDVRGGQGERDVFRAGLERLRSIDPVAYANVVKFVPEYGRWDDLYGRWDDDDVSRTELTPEVQSLIAAQWNADCAAYEAGERVSLLAKWLPSDKAADTQLAVTVRESLGLTQREYRHTLTVLRERIGLLEHAMTTKDYSGVDYGKLPGQAHRKHVKAFWRNDQPRYEAFLAAVEKGEATVNAGTVYPYEVYDMVQRGDVKAAEAIWKNLPDYTRPGQDALVLADVSGSMYGRPMSVSVSLALYFAQRNTGAYKGYFMCFESKPSLVHIPPGAGLKQAMDNIQYSTNWCGSTNLKAAFDAILKAGIQSGSTPAVLYIVSDMQFDQAVAGAGLSVFENAQVFFRRAGLELPHVVFWNVNARHDQLPATILDGNVTLVSGLSSSVFGMAVEGKSPRALVDDVVNGERYQQIIL